MGQLRPSKVVHHHQRQVVTEVVDDADEQKMKTCCCARMQDLRTGVEEAKSGKSLEKTPKRGKPVQMCHA